MLKLVSAMMLVGSMAFASAAKPILTCAGAHGKDAWGVVVEKASGLTGFVRFSKNGKLAYAGGATYFTNLDVWGYKAGPVTVTLSRMQPMDLSLPETRATVTYKAESEVLRCTYLPQ